MTTTTRTTIQPGTVPSVTLPLQTAIENAWATIQRHHPEVPGVVVTLGGAGERGRQHLGWFAPGRWQVGEDQQGELFIGAEGQTVDAESMLVTVLHAAAHGLAAARDIQDTSRQTRYHNAKFRELAEEVGLSVEPGSSTIGWTTQGLAPGTVDRYASALEDLADVLANYQRPEPATGSAKNKDSYNGVVAVCGCAEPRRIRVRSREQFELGPILCGICRQPFTAPADTAEPPH